MRTYEQMNDVLEIMWGNLMEADKYVKMAHELKDECRTFADWCKDMANKHIEFNATGKNVYERMKDKLGEDSEHADAAHHPGILLILDRQMAKLNQHGAEIRAKLDAYK